MLGILPNRVQAVTSAALNRAITHKHPPSWEPVSQILQNFIHYVLTLRFSTGSAGDCTQKEPHSKAQRHLLLLPKGHHVPTDHDLDPERGLFSFHFAL